VARPRAARLRGAQLRLLRDLRAGRVTINTPAASSRSPNIPSSGRVRAVRRTETSRRVRLKPHYDRVISERERRPHRSRNVRVPRTPDDSVQAGDRGSRRRRRSERERGLFSGMLRSRISLAGDDQRPASRSGVPRASVDAVADAAKAARITVILGTER
jgi:hypothetical protein